MRGQGLDSQSEQSRPEVTNGETEAQIGSANLVKLYNKEEEELGLSMVHTVNISALGK